MGKPEVKMKKNTIIQAAALTVPIVLLYAASALSQPRDNPIERARHHMELGQDAFNNGRYEEAAEQFVNAFTASPFAAFLYNAGLAYEKGGKLELAVDFYRRYLEAEPEAHDYAKVDVKIRTLLADAETPESERQVVIEEVEMKSLISVRSNPPDAKIRILDTEGNLVSESSGTSAQTVEHGTYTVEASHPDYRTVQTDINVTSGQVYIVVVEMSQGAFLGFLHVETDVPGAEVYVDDLSAGQVGITPWGNVLPTGKHKLWIEKPGYLPITREVEVALGEELNIALQLKRPDFGILHVKANVPNATVSIGQELLGTVPLEKQVRPGRHMVTVSAEGMKDYVTEVPIARGNRSKLLARMNPRPSRTSAWVSLGFSVALLAGGGVAGIMAINIKNDLEHDRNEGTLASDDERIMHGFVWALSADLAFGVGALVGGLSIYYFLRDPLPPSEGKIFKPVDFTENPENISIVAKAPRVKAGEITPAPNVEGPKEQSQAGEEPATPEPSKSSDEAAPPSPSKPSDEAAPGEPETNTPAPETLRPKEQTGPRFAIAPILGVQAQGIGLYMSF